MRFPFGCMTSILIGAQVFIATPAGSQPIDYRSVIRDAGEILLKGTGQPPGQPSQPYPGDVPRPPPGATLVGNLEGDPASILEAQTHLNVLGYEPGLPDGVLGGETRRALQRFQRVMNLPATGELSAPTMSALRNATRNQGQPSQQPAARAGTAPSAGVPAAGHVAHSGVNGVRAIAPVMQNGRLLTGFPVLHGRFNKEQVEIGPYRRHYVKSSLDLALYMDLFVLRHWPDVLKRQDYAYDYANRFLTGSLLAKYVSGCQHNCSVGIPFDGWAGRNEFEREESYQAFVRDAPALLGSLAPDAPVEALLVLEVQVQPYDSKVSAFPINVVRPALSLFGTVSPASRASTVAEFEVPSRVSLSRADAPAFLDQLPAQRRIAYLGLVVSIGKPDWNPHRASATMAMTLKTAKLYLDPDLQRQIHDFDAATASAAAGQAAPPAPPDRLPVVRNPGDGRLASLANDIESVTRSLLVAGWRAKPEIASNEHVLLNLARSLLPERERTALINQNYGQWAGVDEFARERSRQEFLTKWQPLLFAQVPQLPLRFSVISLSQLGDYDTGNQRFPFRWIEFHRGGREPRTIVLSTHTLFGGHRIDLDKAPPSFLPMSRSDAEAFLQRRREAIAAQVRRNRQSSTNTAGLERLVVFRAE
ncbi:MAG: peptidoglycan-binding domain-containing protein, partial [Pirellulaceae bacterium]